MKYCCNDFEVYATAPSTNIPNIRIVKYKPVQQGIENNNFGFYCTSGYEKFSIYLPKLNLKYCPFCAISLREYYKQAKYANEIEGETF